MPRKKHFPVKSGYAEAMQVIDHIEQLAGIGHDRRSPGHDDDALRNRAVARLRRLHADLITLRGSLDDDATQQSLSLGYPDLVEWCGTEGRSYSEVALELGVQLYRAVVLQCVEHPPEDVWNDPMQPVDEAALRAVWSRVAAHLERFGRQVPWRNVERLRQRVTAEHDRAAQAISGGNGVEREVDNAVREVAGFCDQESDGLDYAGHGRDEPGVRLQDSSTSIRGASLVGTTFPM